MRFFIVLCSVLAFAVPAIAQTNSMAEQMKKLRAMPPQEQQQYLQDMMRNAGRMQQCFEAAGGEDGVRELQARGNKVKAEVAALCEAGKRDEAQAYALTAAREMEQDSRAPALKSCARDLSAQFPFMLHLADPNGYLNTHHICDAREDFS